MSCHVMSCDGYRCKLDQLQQRLHHELDTHDNSDSQSVNHTRSVTLTQSGKRSTAVKDINMIFYGPKHYI